MKTRQQEDGTWISFEIGGQFDAIDMFAVGETEDESVEKFSSVLESREMNKRNRHAQKERRRIVKAWTRVIETGRYHGVSVCLPVTGKLEFTKPVKMSALMPHHYKDSSGNLVRTYRPTCHEARTASCVNIGASLPTPVRIDDKRDLTPGECYEIADQILEDSSKGDYIFGGHSHA